MEASGSEASLDEEDDEVDRCGLEAALDEVVDEWSEPSDAPTVSAEKLVRNKASRMLHLLADEGGTVLVCGRGCTRNYDRVASVPRFLFPTCSRCFESVAQSADVDPS